MSLATEDQLGYDEWKIYDYIARHFIASVSHNCTMTKCKAIFKIGDEEFKSSGLRMKTPGFTEVMPWMQPKDDYIPNFAAISKEVPVKEISLSDGQTSPPDYLTESELIGLVNHYQQMIFAQ